MMLKWSDRRFLSLILIVAAVAGYIAVIRPSNETPIERAHRICKDCGLLGPEIDELIQQVRESGLTPSESIQLWKDAADPGAVELCRECVDAVVKAVGLHTND